MLRCCELEQLADFPLGLAFHGSCWRQQALEQDHRGGDVLASTGEPWRPVVILHDPWVHVMSPGASSPTVGMMMRDLTFKLIALALQLTLCLV